MKKTLSNVRFYGLLIKSPEIISTGFILVYKDYLVSFVC